MARGAGVILQRYSDGGMADAKVFRLADGLTWRLGEQDADRDRTCATGSASARRPGGCRRTGFPAPGVSPRQLDLRRQPVFQLRQRPADQLGASCFRGNELEEQAVHSL